MAHYESYNDNPYYWHIRLDNDGLTPQEIQTFIAVNLGGATSSADPGVQIVGDPTANFIWGTTNARDTVLGGSDNDTIYGFGGDDSLVGGDGDDELYGAYINNNVPLAGNDNCRDYFCKYA